MTGRRTTLMATSLRIDRRTWAKVKFHADRLGLARAALIRDAVMLHIAAIETSDKHLYEQAEPVITDHGQRIARIERWIALQGGEL